MLVQGDISCLHCGFDGGMWTGERGSALTYSGLRQNGSTIRGGPDEAIRCQRCQGPVLFGNIRAAVTPQRLRRIQRMREQLARYDAEAMRHSAA